MAYNIITDAALSELVSKTKTELNKKVDAETGKTLTANDLTNALKAKYDQAVSDVASLKSVGAEKNKIETIKVNGIVQEVDDTRTVDISMFTEIEAQDLIEGYGYQTAADVETAITAKGYQTATQVNTAIESKGYQTSAEVQTAIDKALEGVTGIDLQIVSSGNLKDITDPKKGVIYLLPNAHGTNDIYDEYIYIGTDADSGEAKYEKIGSTDADLSGYVKTTDITEVGATEIDTLWNSVS